ncbi:MAG: CHASE2 domain-containing protein, partial [Myxococcaceae bacterium]
MRVLPVQSAGRRFVQKFGFAFLWAAFLGGVIGGLVYYRAPRAGADEVQPWYALLRSGLDRAELWTFDWRVRELGRESTRSDAVVVVAVDDEALASAREDTSHAVGGHPWPREVLGGVTEQILREGGALVLFDLPFADLSPRGCAGAPDDQLFRERLDRQPGRSLLTFGWSRNPPPPPERELRPTLVFVESHASLEDARGDLRRILAARAPAYLIPDGKRLQLWAAAASEGKAKELGDALGLSSPRTTRQRLASEQDYEVAPWELLASLSAVEVDGLEVAKLPQVRFVEPPIGPLLSEKSLYGGNVVTPDFDGTVRGLPHLVHFAPKQGKGV